MANNQIVGGVELAPAGFGETSFTDLGGQNDPINKPGTDKPGPKPSEKITKAGKAAPPPYFLAGSSIPIIGSPLMGNPVVTDQLHLGGAKIYIKNKKLYVSIDGHDLEVVMINPAGLTQSSDVNKLSDGSDGSKGQSLGNTAVSGRTVPQGTTNTTASNSTPAGSSSNTPAAANVDNILRTIRFRESTNNYNAQAKTSSASGAYQFIDSTWQEVSAQAGYKGAYKHAKDAPPAIQDAVARYYVNSILAKSNGDINAVPNVWFTGNVNGNMSAKQQAANPGVTSAIYRNRFWSTFNNINGSNTTALAYTNTPSSVPAAFANMSPGQGFPSSVASNINTSPNNANSTASSTEQLANKGAEALGEAANSTLTTVPCIPNEISATLNKLRPGGLVGLVVDLTDITKELSKITKKITELLPGVPFSVTGQIIQMFIDGFNELNGVVKKLDTELLKGLNTIIAELNCITQDITAVTSGIQSVINSWTTTELIKILPDNLSIDDVIDGKMNSALVNIQLDSTQPKQTAEVPIFTEDQLYKPNPVPQSTLDATTIPDSELQYEYVESEVRTVDFSESNIESETIEFQITCETARPYLDARLGRAIKDDEYAALIAAAYEIASANVQEVVWFSMTIVNRCAKTGSSVIEILKDFLPEDQKTQKYIYGPLADYEVAINQAIINYGDNVPTNNFYFDSFRAEVKDTNTYVASRKGVLGIAVGQSFVYPGAKWP